MARRRIECGGSGRGKGHADALPTEREIRMVGRGSDVAVPCGAARGSPHRPYLSLVQTHPVSTPDVLRGVLPSDRRMDLHPGHGNDRDLLDFLSRHGCETHRGSDPRRRREPGRCLAQDGDDALLRGDDEGRDPHRDAGEGRLEAARGSPRQRARHPLLPASAGGRTMTFLERTTDARKFRHWEGNMEADYIYTSGVAGEKFFVTLRDEGRLLASRCTACGLDYLPARLFCEDCFAELTESVEVPGEGRVTAVSVAHVDRTGAPLSKPQVWAFVTFRGVRGGVGPPPPVPPGPGRGRAPGPPETQTQNAPGGAVTGIQSVEPPGFR